MHGYICGKGTIIHILLEDSWRFLRKQKPAPTGSDKRLSASPDFDIYLYVLRGIRTPTPITTPTPNLASQHSWSAPPKNVDNKRQRRHSGCCSQRGRQRGRQAGRQPGWRRRYVVIVIITLMPTKHIQIITLRSGQARAGQTSQSSPGRRTK